MSVTFAKTRSIVGPGGTVSFAASSDVPGATVPTWSVLPGGAGGTIVYNTGVYTAPSVLDFTKPTDTIAVTMANSHFQPLDSGQTTIRIAHPIFLFLDIIQREMGLDDSHIYLWNQKMPQPKGDGVYVIVSVLDTKVIGNNMGPGGTNGGWDQSKQYVNLSHRLDINLVSRDNSAVFRQAELVMALNSAYSNSQQEANSFKVSKVPRNLVNVSGVDGTAIPFRYVLTCQLQYSQTKVQAIDYFTEVPLGDVVTNP